MGLSKTPSSRPSRWSQIRSAPGGAVSTSRTDAMARLMAPKSVAVVGASASSIGADVLGNLERFHYAGEVYVVSRSGIAFGGRSSVASISDLPRGIDAAVLCVPRDAVVDALEACAELGVRAAVVFASGFAEAGEHGAADQARLAEVAQRKNIAILGPNCLGLTNFVAGIPLGFTYRQPAPPGSGSALSILAQSGAIMGNLRGATQARGLNVAYAISTGNEAAITIEDCLEYILNDGRIGPIAIFAEALRQPRAFLDLAARARMLRRPIVLFHPGRSAAARDSARSHTGALAGDYDLMRARCLHEGVIMVESLDELIDTSAILTRFPAGCSNGVAMLSDSGAFRGIALDFCASIGLDCAPLAPATLERLSKLLPPYAAASNPLDLTTAGLRDFSLYGNASQALVEDPGVGAFVVSVMPGTLAQGRAIGDAILPVLEASTKPSAYVVMGGPTPVAPELVAALREAAIPFFRSPEAALRAMGHVISFGRTVDRVRSIAQLGPTVDPHVDVRAEYQGKAVLAAAGVTVPPGALAHSIEDAVAIAGRIGYPVVLKAQAPQLVHKSDAGGVRVGIHDARELAAAWIACTAAVAERAPGVVLDGFLIEAQCAAPVELIVAARRDSAWGLVLVAGLGGIWTEALGDVRLIAPDASPSEIRAELFSLRAAALLRGARGTAPVDVDSIVDVLRRLAGLLEANPRLREIEINPLAVSETGAIALDVVFATAD